MFKYKIAVATACAQRSARLHATDTFKSNSIRSHHRFVTPFIIRPLKSLGLLVRVRLFLPFPNSSALNNRMVVSLCPLSRAHSFTFHFCGRVLFSTVFHHTHFDLTLFG